MRTIRFYFNRNSIQKKQKGMSIRRPKSGGLSNVDILQTWEEGGSSDANVRTFWCKTSDFQNV